MIFAFVFIIANSQNTRLLSREEAWSIVKSNVLKGNINDVNVSVMDTLLSENSEIDVMFEDEKAPAFKSWFFFIDDRPFESWEHPCRYVFVNAETGHYEVLSKKRPPLSVRMLSLVDFVVPRSLEKISEYRKFVKKDTKTSSAVNDYAVIISGGANKMMNYERYWNDCSAIYSTLVSVYGYLKDHIYVLISDGTNSGVDRRLINGTFDSSPLDLDGDGSDDVEYSATRKNISAVFDELSEKMTDKDNLFVYTIDHGGQSSGRNVHLYLWNDEYITDAEFAIELDKINANKINVCMGQCYSGGFIDNLAKENRIIATACGYDESSWAMSNLMYDEFVYHWTAAVAGYTPSGQIVNADANNDGNVSMYEAFSYAKSNDTRNETPMYSSTPENMGENLYLAQLYTFDIIGETVNCDSAVYYVSNLSDGMEVVWEKQNADGAYYFYTDYPLKNQCMVSRMTYPYYYSMDLVVTVYKDDNVLARLTKRIYGKPTVFYGTLWQDACSFHGVEHPELGPVQVRENEAVFVHQGCMARIYSGQFDGMDITHSGMEPENFYVHDDEIEFNFPYGSGGTPMTIKGVCENANANFSLLVFAVTGNGNVSNSLSVKPLGVGYELTYSNSATSLNGNSFVDDDFAWDMDVYDVQSGTKVQTVHVLGQKYYLNTEDWPSGIYVVRAISGDNICAEKIQVK